MHELFIIINIYLYIHIYRCIAFVNERAKIKSTRIYCWQAREDFNHLQNNALDGSWKWFKQEISWELPRDLLSINACLLSIEIRTFTNQLLDCPWTWQSCNLTRFQMSSYKWARKYSFATDRRYLLSINFYYIIVRR